MPMYKLTIRITLLLSSQSIKQVANWMFPVEGNLSYYKFVIMNAERLKGQEHAINGKLSQRCYDEKAFLVKFNKVSFWNFLRIHTFCSFSSAIMRIFYNKFKFSEFIKMIKRQLLQKVGQNFTPKLNKDINNKNSGLPKVRNCYGNGGFIVVRRNFKTITNEGDQPNLQKNFEVDTSPPQKPFELKDNEKQLSKIDASYKAFF